jgi:hypothetical protein
MYNTLHREAEAQTMLDVGEFIKKSQAQGYRHFINDAGGSLCELDDNKVIASYFGLRCLSKRGKTQRTNASGSICAT